MNLFWQECKMNFKTMLVWALCVGGMCLGCLLLYDSLGESVEEMSDMFANLGAFSEALGMDRMGIGTLEGYYAVEISILLNLGGALYGAMLGAGMTAKEEEGKTYEFLNVMPLGSISWNLHLSDIVRICLDGQYAGYEELCGISRCGILHVL